MKVREIITFKHWVKGSGWSYEECYKDSVIDVEDINDVDFDWFELDEENPPSEESDTKIIVEFFAENANITEDKPLASYSIWASNLYMERK